MSDDTKVADGLFGPGIFATGIDLSALDSDTAYRLGIWIGEQLRRASDDINHLAKQRDEARADAKRADEARRGVQKIIDDLTDRVTRAEAEASEAGGEHAIAHAHAQTLSDDLAKMRIGVARIAAQLVEEAERGYFASTFTAYAEELRGLLVPGATS